MDGCDLSNKASPKEEDSLRYVAPGFQMVTHQLIITDWSIVCLQINLGGATGRPVPADIWKIVQAKMDDPDSAHSVTVQKQGMFSVFR